MVLGQSLTVLFCCTLYRSSHSLLRNPWKSHSFRVFSCNENKIPYDITPFTSYIPNVTSQKIEKLNELMRMLVDWNSKVNLISRKDIEHLIPNHIMPSLSINLVYSFGKNERVIDIGTGGGLPGLPLAITNPDTYFTLLDSNSKKMMIVQDMASRLKLSNVRVICARAETVSEKFDVLLGRAVSALPTFLSFSAHLISKRCDTDIINSNRGLYYLKGGDFEDEIAEAGICRENTKLNAVRSLVPIETDKFVLYVPTSEILAFQRNYKTMNQTANKR